MSTEANTYFAVFISQLSKSNIIDFEPSCGCKVFNLKNIRLKAFPFLFGSNIYAVGTKFGKLGNPMYCVKLI